MRYNNFYNSLIPFIFTSLLLLSFSSMLIFVTFWMPETNALSMARRDWSKLNLDELDQQWNNNDNEQNLFGDDDATPDELLYRESERRRAQATEKLQKYLNDNNFNSNRRGESSRDIEFKKLTEEAQNAGKPAMIFAKLFVGEKTETSSVGGINTASTGWDWDSLANVCGEWEYYLRFEMIKITCYPMEPNTILVTVKQGWDGDKVYRYLAMQDSIIEELTWNDKIIRPSKKRLEDEF